MNTQGHPSVLECEWFPSFSFCLSICLSVNGLDAYTEQLIRGVNEWKCVIPSLPAFLLSDWSVTELFNHHLMNFFRSAGGEAFFISHFQWMGFMKGAPCVTVIRLVAKCQEGGSSRREEEEGDRGRETQTTRKMMCWRVVKHCQRINDDPSHLDWFSLVSEYSSVQWSNSNKVLCKEKILISTSNYTHPQELPYLKQSNTITICIFTH